MDWENYLRAVYSALHTKRLVAPWGSDAILLTSGGTAYAWGAYGNDLVAAGYYPNNAIHIENLMITAGASAEYEISVVYGTSDIECAEGYITGPKSDSTSLDMNSNRIPPGSRIRARCRDNAGGKTVTIKIGYHLLPQGL